MEKLRAYFKKANSTLTPLRPYFSRPERGVEVNDILNTVTWADVPTNLAFSEIDSSHTLLSFDDDTSIYTEVEHEMVTYYRVKYGSTVLALGTTQRPNSWINPNFDFGGRKVAYISPDASIKTVIRQSASMTPLTGYFAKKEEVPPPYLTFQSASPFTLNVYDNTKHWDGTLYYSTDTTTWNEWNGTTALNSVNNKLYLRGTGNTVIAGSSSNYRWVLTGTAIECIGNIENLLDWETVALGGHPTMAQSCYYNMFNGCTSLATAPALPATTLATDCCSRMFRGCTSLTTAPALPATTLAAYCYREMFYGCSVFKVSATQTGSYQHAWRIPTSGTGTTATSWNDSMLTGTGGTFKGYPVINTTYYVENPPV